MYNILCTQPGICFVVGLISRYQSNLGPGHWKTVKRIVRNLRGTTNLVLYYLGGNLMLIGYSYANWDGDSDESMSTLGYLLTTEQDFITLLSIEVEYVTYSIFTQEVIQPRSFLHDLNLTPRIPDPVEMLCDNTAAVQFTKDSKFHRKTKYIKRHYHFVQEVVKTKKIVIKYISINKMIADLLTNSQRCVQSSYVESRASQGLIFRCILLCDRQFFFFFVMIIYVIQIEVYFS